MLDLHFDQSFSDILAPMVNFLRCGVPAVQLYHGLADCEAVKTAVSMVKKELNKLRMPHERFSVILKDGVIEVTRAVTEQ